jgi:hypothetical protein
MNQTRFGIFIIVTMNITLLFGNDVPVYIAEYPRRNLSSISSSLRAKKLISSATRPAER